MTFSRANSGGFVHGQTIEATEIETIDVNQSRAVDGYAGGDYSPSSPIVLVTGAPRIRVEEGSLLFENYAYPDIQASEVIQSIPLIAAYVTTNSGADDWTYGVSLRQNHIAHQSVARIPWQPNPYVGTIISMSFAWVATASHTALPATMPMLELYKQMPDDATATKIAEVSDTTSVLADYKLPHTTTLGGLSVAIDPDEAASWSFFISGEFGTDSMVYSKLLGISVIIEVTKLMP